MVLRVTMETWVQVGLVWLHVQLWKRGYRSAWGGFTCNYGNVGTGRPGVVLRVIKLIFLSFEPNYISLFHQKEVFHHVFDFKHCISQYKAVLGNWQSSYRRCRKDEGVLCRARIGHTHLTHSYILRKGPPPQCEHCQCILTVHHILVMCNNFDQERKGIIGRRDVIFLKQFET